MGRHGGAPCTHIYTHTTAEWWSAALFAVASSKVVATKTRMTPVLVQSQCFRMENRGVLKEENSCVWTLRTKRCAVRTKKRNEDTSNCYLRED